MIIFNSYCGGFLKGDRELLAEGDRLSLLRGFEKGDCRLLQEAIAFLIY
ncbi:hypothetical protein I8748_02160 [Nostoc sp. CENA67]|uniref:Uncharacterized protein n=1 Tax=Amazonocrinis nigriterrae CENA67 TaxID=2794033 RepID=A0A8J7HJY4_9NOST|nr:hypothetical protein [Amazonocrinis nigriterrae]MBH8560992.1 hypothetical protein [Amazonocrinis nigriterrae CENA67]